MLNILVEKKTEIVGIRFENSFLEQLKENAHREGLTLSESIRRVIKNAMR